MPIGSGVVDPVTPGTVVGLPVGSVGTADGVGVTSPLAEALRPTKVQTFGDDFVMISKQAVDCGKRNKKVLENVISCQQHERCYYIVEFIQFSCLPQYSHSA